MPIGAPGTAFKLRLPDGTVERFEVTVLTSMESPSLHLAVLIPEG
jgi:hypothetical protein